jgi:leader peptidase (prepilin peptidase)/N-methyltransferase
MALVAGLFLGMGVGAGAVVIARSVPATMDLALRPRPRWWWLAAVAAGGVLGALGAVRLETDWALPAYLVFAVVTLSLTLTDLDYRLIPNRILFPGMGIAVALLLGGALIEQSGGAWLRAVAAGAVYFLVLLIIGLVARGGFGMGDVKLAALLGAFLGYLGWGELVVGAVLAILLGGVVSIVLLATRVKSRNDRFAYGPYLVLGAYVGILYGAGLLDWYLR